MVKQYLVLRLSVALIALPMLVLPTGCSKDNPVSPVITAEQTATPADTTQTGRIDKPGVELSVVIGSDRNKPGFKWNYGDWTSRIAWEARKALSQSANGTSGWPVPDDAFGSRWFGDWNYVASDAYARDQAMEEATDVGTLTDDVDGHHRGGWCTFFVRLILYRATYWAGYGVHLTTPGFPGSVYSWTSGMTQNYASMKPGWVFSSPSSPHMAIADQRTIVKGKWGWYVIDSNYVGGSGKFYIAKHFLTDEFLKSKGYYGWYPDWATSN